jgi:hypothetical protein
MSSMKLTLDQETACRDEHPWEETLDGVPRKCHWGVGWEGEDQPSGLLVEDPMAPSAAGSCHSQIFLRQQLFDALPPTQHPA